MKRATLATSGFQIIEEEMPKCGASEVLIKTSGCGICEGEFHRYLSIMKNSENINKPIFMGHEGSGIVAELGANVTGFTVGDKVTACGGAYGEYFVCAPDSLAKVPEGVDVSLALGEPIACCMHAANRFGIKLGDRVAIIGCGYMGLICLQLSKLLGAAEIVAFDLIDWRLDTAKKLGADVTINSKDRDPKDLAVQLGQFDVTIEATGAQEVLDLGTALLRNHGTMNLVGTHHGELRHIEMLTWNVKALTVVNGHVRNENEKVEAMKAGLRLMAHGKIDTSSLITNYKFEDINQAFLDLKNRKKGLYKANLIF